MTSDRPTAPSPDDVEAFVKWMVRHGHAFADLRMLYPSNLDRLVELSWRDVSQEITKRSLLSADALMSRAGEIGQWYTDNMQKLVEQRGGIGCCPPEVRITVAAIRIKIGVMLRLAKYKYGARISDEIVGPL